MGTGAGAAGVRIELHDNSAYTVITTPKATAGIVGFAPKGELNKIQRITNTAELDTYFGLGFNNSRYNQGLYAARAVLNASGYVEYIRPYGEEIDISDPFKRDLKTDAFVVAFDRDAMNITKQSGAKTNTDNTSLKIEYFASTRYKTDGAANYGVTRKINNVAEAVAKNTNVEFSVDAEDYAELSNRSRGETDMVLFAMLGADPSIANRAYTSYKVTHVEDKGDDDNTVSTMECATNPGFSAGSIVYAPAAPKSSDTELYSYMVTNIVDRKLFLTANDAKAKAAIKAYNYHPSVLFYHDDENGMLDGTDYLTVRTAVAGRGSKLFSVLELTEANVNNLANKTDGYGFTVHDANCVPQLVRFKTGKPASATLKANAGASGSVEYVTLTMTTTPLCMVDEIIKITYAPDGGDAVTGSFKVTAIDDDTKTVTAVPVDGDDMASATNKSVTFVIDSFVTPVVNVKNGDKNKTADVIVSEIATLLKSAPFGYANAVIGSDIDAAFTATSKELHVTAGEVFNFKSGDKVAIVRAANDSVSDSSVPAILGSGVVDSVDGYNSKVILVENAGITPVTGEKYKLINLTTTSRAVYSADFKTTTTTETTDETTDETTTETTVTLKQSALFLVSNYANTVNMDMQQATAPIVLDDNDAVFTVSKLGGSHIVESSEKVLMDSSIGDTFVGLGLATIQYMDVNFTGKAIKVFDLTEEGEAIARLYLGVTYKFAGNLYDFEGTIVPYVYNNLQLSIADAADMELTGTGVKFVLNESGELDMFREDNSYDLSGTVEGGKPSGAMSMGAFNELDPALVYDAVWSYNPQNNISTSTVATAYSLFLDKDNSDIAFIVGAGMGVNNFGLKKYETLNTAVMEAVLRICELRKDCFALFDGVNERDIEKALKKDILAARFPSQLGRWGAIYDARPVFFDSTVTLTNVEVAPSIAMANLITANRSDSIFWRPPAGKINGIVPGAWCSTTLNKRQFSYPEDPDSDIARLSDIHVNPFRTTNDGIYVWMDYTMQQEDTAFNQIHVAMLIAGVHKLFYHYLDGLVFQLNTPALRSQIQGNIQAQLDQITFSNPSGFEEAVCICDDTNNPPSVINQNKLYVDLKLKPTKSIRFITLRTTVESSGDGNTITTTMD